MFTYKKTHHYRPWISVIVMSSIIHGITGCSSNDDNKDIPMNDPIGEIPTQPAQLTGVVYTEVETEIFWQPASDADGVIMGYDIVRNGQLLATRLDALSYYDNTVAPASSYSYTVIAVDNDDNRGEPSSINLNTPERSPTVNIANYNDILNYVFSLYTGDVYNRLIRTGYDFFHANDATEVTYPNAMDGSLSDRLYECINGGHVTVRSLITGSGADQDFDMRYTNCEWNALLYDGHLFYNLNPYSQNNWTYEDFTITLSNGTRIAINGTAQRNYLAGKVFTFNVWSTDIEHFESGAFEGATVLRNVNTEFAYGDEFGTDRAWLKGSFQTRAPQTGNKPITVFTLVDFVNDEGQDRSFPIGTLKIEAADGSALTLNADNGDIATVSITVAAEGEEHTFTETWNRWRDALTFETAL